MAHSYSIATLANDQLDDGTVTKLQKLAKDLGFESHGRKPSITRLMRAVAKIEPTTLEEVLSDANALPGQHDETED